MSADEELIEAVEDELHTQRIEHAVEEAEEAAEEVEEVVEELAETLEEELEELHEEVEVAQETAATAAVIAATTPPAAPSLTLEDVRQVFREEMAAHEAECEEEEIVEEEPAKIERDEEPEHRSFLYRKVKHP